MKHIKNIFMTLLIILLIFTAINTSDILYLIGGCMVIYILTFLLIANIYYDYFNKENE